MNPGERFGRFEILNIIGRGGMGAVYRAVDPAIGRTVAIKTVQLSEDRDLFERFLREARTVGNLAHPNIVTVYDVERSEDSAYIVMEYVSGHTLERELQQNAGAPRTDLMPVLLDCARGLDYAHGRGVIHRDIKPSNVMICDGGSAKILDFGIAKTASANEIALTQHNIVAGTPSHMSPEQILGNPVEPAADQYSLGVIAWQLLTGQLPFSGSSVPELIQKALNQKLPPVSTVNPNLNHSVDQVMAKVLGRVPALRYPSCGEFVGALVASLEPNPSLAKTSGLGALLRNIWPRKQKTATNVQPGMTRVGAPDLSKALRPPGSGAPPKPAVWETADAAPAERASLTLELSKGPAQPTGNTAGRSSEAAGKSQQGNTNTETAEPGEFTRMFLRTGTAAETPKPKPPPPSNLSPPPPEPGEFTRFFRAANQSELLNRHLEHQSDADMIARAQARELIEILQARDFESGTLLRGKWLPGIDSAPSELRGFSEAARYLAAAQESVSSHLLVEHLKRSEAILFSVGNQLFGNKGSLQRHLPEALEVWKEYTLKQLVIAQQRATTEIPNPFRAGQPLRPDEGRSVFRGRKDLVRRIEEILADARQNSSLALLGPRRCGKTSLLQMLPAMLPDCACIFFDLQDNPVQTVPAFFEALVRRAREQVRRQMAVEVPILESGGIFESAARWFEALDNVPNVKRWLICIDEFERLEDLFPGNRSDLLRLMGLLRAVIQHRRTVRVLVSGVAPFEELGSLWNDHFINLRELRIGHLGQDTSIDLLTQPIAEFPVDAVPEAVAARIYDRTGGQPYLLQLYGALLVNLLNETARTSASLEDVALVEEDALSQGRYFFSNIYHDAPEEARQVLTALAKSAPYTTSSATKRWLNHRCLITEDGQLNIPVLGTFINEEAAS